MTSRRTVWMLPLLLALGACRPDQNLPRCAEPVRTGLLPHEVPESSGVVASRLHAGVLWTHNDSGHGPYLFAIDSAGTLLGRTRVEGAENFDWEDIAYGPCLAAHDEECLYIGDIGDNLEARRHVRVYVVPEPDPADASTPPAQRLTMQYPDGPRDAEALAVLPDGRMLVITKGRNHPPAVYRWPGKLPTSPTDEVATLEHVQDLADGAAWIPDQVTGATTTPDGAWVIVRTYTWLQFYQPLGDGALEAVPPRADLTPAGEPQGEAVDVRADGTIFLTSEEGPLGRRGTVSMMQCRLPP